MRRRLQKCPRRDADCKSAHGAAIAFLCALRGHFSKSARGCTPAPKVPQSAISALGVTIAFSILSVSTTRALSGSLYGVNVRTVDTFRRFGPNARVHPKVTTVCTSTFVTTSQLYGHRGHFSVFIGTAGTFLRRCPRPRDRDFPRFPARDPWALCKNRVRNSGPRGHLLQRPHRGHLRQKCRKCPRSQLRNNVPTVGT